MDTCITIAATENNVAICSHYSYHPRKVRLKTSSYGTHEAICLCIASTNTPIRILSTEGTGHFATNLSSRLAKVREREREREREDGWRGKIMDAKEWRWGGKVH